MFSPAHFYDNMFPPHDGPLGIFSATAGCLAVGSLLTAVVSCLRPSYSNIIDWIFHHLLQWVYLIVACFYPTVYPYDLARNAKELGPLCVASKSSFTGFVASTALLRFLSFYLVEDLGADARTNSSGDDDVGRRNNSANMMFLVPHMIHSLGILAIPSDIGPMCNPGFLRTGLYVVWMLARAAAIRDNIATFRTVFSSGLTTPKLSVIRYAIIVIYICVTAQIPLELGAVVFNARALLVLSMVSMQVAIAAMLLVCALRIWRRGNAKSLSDEKPDELLQTEKSL
ncbi:unnamed protein product [Clonostachys byssicola]|uniref:Uncharacterized protein n=1 Tax=Clonostachys byssicola TaxID=160290 RepID=A0A9N9UHJ7_9HYPO|nr:unnamed protein product [Clonostachys byssicola]